MSTHSFPQVSAWSADVSSRWPCFQRLASPAIQLPRVISSRSRLGRQGRLGLVVLMQRRRPGAGSGKSHLVNQLLALLGILRIAHQTLATQSVERLEPLL